MVLLFNLLKFHKNGGGGDEVLGFWFHKNDLLKLNKNNWRSWNSTSIYLFHVRNDWLKTTSQAFAVLSQRSPSPTRRAWKRWATRRKVRPKRLDPLGLAMEVSAGKIIDLPAMFDCEWVWDYGKGFSAFWSTFDAQPFLCEDGRFGEFLFLSHCF